MIDLMLNDLRSKAGKVLLLLLEVSVKELYLNGLITGSFSYAV